MAVNYVSPALAIRSSVGVELWSSSSPKEPYEYKEHLPREETKYCRSIAFSPDGRYFAYSNGTVVKLLETSDWNVKLTFPRAKSFYLQFSPCGNYLCTWELYIVTKNIPEGTHNMFVYEVATGTLVYSAVQKKQTDWAPSWSSDESIFAVFLGGEAIFYDLRAESGFNSPAARISGCRGGMVSVAPGNSPPHVAIYTPGLKGSPSMCKLYKYPNLGVQQLIACKSFFNADRVEMMWNQVGTGLLLLTSTEVDRTGASYYGNQALHFLCTKGDTCSVPLSKEGPIHCVKWNPKANEFIVVFGFMPSKVALFNFKCDVIFDFDTGPRNCAYFSPFGNLVVLAGFGNLPGNVEIWDVPKRDKLASIKCPDTTLFEWSPDGEHFMTATTAPRLRIGNGFKIYHYSGALIHETIWPQGQELLALEWQQFAPGRFAEPFITKTKQEGIKSSQPEASKKAYTPPHLRLLKEGKNPLDLLPQPQKHRFSGNGNNNKKLSAKKYNHKGNKNKNRLSDSGINIPTSASTTCAGATSAPTGPRIDFFNQFPCDVDDMMCGNNGYLNVGGNFEPKHDLNIQRPYSHQNIPMLQQLQTQHSETASCSFGIQLDAGNNAGSSSCLAVNSERDFHRERKIRNVAKKLSDIKKLKIRQEQGQTLQVKQLDKISMEAQFVEELKALKISSPHS